MTQSIATKIKPGLAKRYFLYKEEFTKLQGLSSENKTTAEITLESLRYNDRECFAVNISDYRQTNDKGLLAWVKDMAPLRQRVIFTLNEDGLLGQIQNHTEIYNKWKSMADEIVQKHRKEKSSINMAKTIHFLMEDPDKFAAALRYAPPYINLFMGINGKKFKDQEINKGYRELYNFIGIKNLPIHTQEVLLKNASITNAIAEIEVSGVLAQDKIDEDKSRSFVRFLRNDPTAPTEIKLKYNENIILNEDHWPLQSICMNLTVIPEFLLRKETTILKEI
jgi:hypothetical protein